MKGNITISRVQGGSDDYINIQIEDEVSRTRFLEVQLTPETLGLALTGLAAQDCEFKTRNLERVGLKRQTKQVEISRPENNKELDLLLKPLEINGWVANYDDAYNDHRWTDNDKVSVTFIRYVK